MIQGALIEAALAAGIAGLGAVSLRIARRGIPATTVVLFAGLVGLLVIAFSTVATLWIVQPSSLLIVWSFVGTALVAFLVVEHRRSELVPGLTIVLVSMLAAGVVTYGLALIVAPVLTFDSWRFLEYGSSVFGDGAHVSFLLQRGLGNYPLALTSVEGLAMALGLEYFASGVGAFGVLAVAGGFDLIAGARAGFDRLIRAVGLVLAVVAVASSGYMTRLQLGYVNSHALAAGFYTIGVAATFARSANLARDATSAEHTRAVLLAIASCGIAMTRVEGLVISGLLLVVAVSYREWSRRSLLVLISIGVVLPGIWYGRLALSLVEADILSPMRMVALIVLAAAPVLLAFVYRERSAILWLTPAALAVIAIAAIFLALDNAPGLATSATSMFLNLASRGLWGGIWWIVLPLSVLALVRIQMRQSSGGWLLLTFGFAFVVLLLGGLREFPYFARWGDSGNRMMIHVLPVFVLMLTYAFLPDRLTDAKVEAVEDQEFSASRAREF